MASKWTRSLVGVLGVLLLSSGAPALVSAQNDDACLPGELCVTVTGLEDAAHDLRLMLYEADESDWPQRYRSLPTPGWVVSEYPQLPDTLELRVQMPFEDNLFAISSNPLEGTNLGLAIATGVDSIMTVDPDDARGFSPTTLVYEPGAALDFGTIELEMPAGTPAT